MSVIVVPAVPPREGLALPRLPETSPLSAAEAADLYEAMLRDVTLAAESSGGDLLVNYLPDDLLPEEHRREESAEAAVRAAVRPALDEPDDARFEEQVGSSFDARMGNTVTHLLEEEGATTAQVVDPAAPLVGRTGIDGAAMKLRRSEVVVGPAPGGRVYLSGFAELVDFTDVYAPPAVETLTDRARGTDFDVDFVEFGPLVETGSDLATLVSLLRARYEAERIVPAYTLATVEDLGLGVDASGDEPALTRGGTDSS